MDRCHRCGSRLEACRCPSLDGPCPICQGGGDSCPTCGTEEILVAIDTDEF